MTFKNTEENPPFYAYLNFIINMQKEVTPLRQQIEQAEGEKKKEETSRLARGIEQGNRTFFMEVERKDKNANTHEDTVRTVTKSFRGVLQ